MTGDTRSLPWSFRLRPVAAVLQRMSCHRVDHLNCPIWHWPLRRARYPLKVDPILVLKLSSAWRLHSLAGAPPVPWWRKFVRQFTDVLVILLLVAAAVSGILWWFERSSALPYEAMAIFAIVLLNAILGYVQQARAEASVAKLRAMSAAEANVLRDGQRHRVSAAEIVPGDIILVEEGDTIPADARLIRETALQTAEASLTGESLPSSKDVAPSPPCRKACRPL